ncbi:54S ribosomal protein L20, mitochondrial [Pseudocercospora fuligena]|uniref:54S ribosomal protein L20, mitochondrial n=1 Tax=Pseudocercospora fuligena TaxID=685502 RepID=A0A8H6R8Z4_9PEZI|nr:54S ribosomal protein L20, mitochondrial [Pseudocercospora fuligena]
MSFLSPSTRPYLFSADAANFVCKTCRRNAASYRRTRKLLRVKQDPSFAPATTETKDHIIFNPPPSAPNVYHTPSKFLPQSDPRRKLYEEALSASKAGARAPTEKTSILARIAAQRQATQVNAKTLKPVRPVYEKQYHLTQVEIDEIRRLRTEDPLYWSRVRLAEKFNCSQFFVSLCVTAPERAKQAEAKIDAIKDKWGRKKSEAREARSERKKLWGRDA